VTNLFTFIFLVFIPGSYHVVGFMLGLGGLMTWTSTIRFFQFAPNFYMFTTAFERGLPQVVRFIISVMPMFIGFGLCGTIMFGEYSRYFLDLNESAITLFSMIFQDNMHDTFDSVFGYKAFTAMFSRLYVYIYTSIFICVIANVFTSIMEDAFFSLKESQEEVEKDDDASTSSTDSHVSIMDVSVTVLQDEADEQYYKNAVEEEEKKELDLIETKEQYFPMDSSLSLNQILDEESIPDNLNRILHIVKTVSKTRELTSEEKELLEQIEKASSDILSDPTQPEVKKEKDE